MRWKCANIRVFGRRLQLARAHSDLILCSRVCVCCVFEVEAIVCHVFCPENVFVDICVSLFVIVVVECGCCFVSQASRATAKVC